MRARRQGPSDQVTGRLKENTWIDKQTGQKRSRIKVSAYSFAFVAPYGGAGAAASDPYGQQSNPYQQQQAQQPAAAPAAAVAAAAPAYGRAAGGEKDDLWRDLVNNPDAWWDNRARKAEPGKPPDTRISSIRIRKRRCGSNPATLRNGPSTRSKATAERARRRARRWPPSMMGSIPTTPIRAIRGALPRVSRIIPNRTAPAPRSTGRASSRDRRAAWRTNLRNPSTTTNRRSKTFSRSSRTDTGWWAGERRAGERLAR